MTINFNNVRKQALYAFDDLVKELNNAIVKNDQWAKVPGCLHDQELNIKGFVLINADDIEKRISDLRQCLVSIALTYEVDNIDFKDVYSEVFPEPESLARFNDEDD